MAFARFCHITDEPMKSNTAQQHLFLLVILLLKMMKTTKIYTCMHLARNCKMKF